MSRAAFDLAMIPAVMILAAAIGGRAKHPEPRTVPAPIVAPAQAAEIEAPIAQRQDQLVTFNRRFEPITLLALPPKDETRFVSHEVRFVPRNNEKGTDDVRDEARAMPVTASKPLPPSRHHRVKQTRRANNVCTRHGMRKITIRGGKGWRCRR